MKEKIKVKACPRGQLSTSLERLLNEIRRGYLAIGDTRLDLPKTVDLKMELEEKDGQVEFELELKWPLHPKEKEAEEEEKEKEKTGEAIDETPEAKGNAADSGRINKRE